jgi:hypothetical protein
MNREHDNHACGSLEHLNRRSILRLAGLSGLSWLTPLATTLARDEEQQRLPAKSLILLWLEGAPSQLETFDPHPGTEIAAGSLARQTNAPGIMIGDAFEQTAEQLDSISLIRGVTSKEGDHLRAVYNIKTGYRPDPTLVHPAIGSVICHELQDDAGRVVDIPRHVSILPGQAPARGGYLGDAYDAFKVFDPAEPVPDIKAQVDQKRQLERIQNLRTVDEQFMQRRNKNKVVQGTLGNHNLDAALKMMSSEQIKAFDVSQAPAAERLQFGDTAFGRGCLAAIRLIEAGVRCVEITLGGWDTHANNHELQRARIDILDPALASLIKELKRRDLLESTVVVCGGEFGRTPYLNPLGGRDHWPQGFSLAIAGGGIQGGRVIGETSPHPRREATAAERIQEIKDPRPVEDVHATVFSALGIQYRRELETPIGRPMKICQGTPISELF